MEQETFLPWAKGSYQWIFGSIFFIFSFFNLYAKPISEAYSSFFNKTIHFREGARVNNLKYFFVFYKFLFQLVKVIFIYFNITYDSLCNLWINNAFTIQVQKYFGLANVFMNARFIALLPKHTYHFTIFNIKNLSLQREHVNVFCSQSIHIENKTSIEKILFLYSRIRYVRQEIT